MTALEKQRAHLLASLEDLERERAAGDLEEADYLALRDDYTARAAAVLRAIEATGAAGAEAAVAPAGSARRSRRRAAAAVGVVAFAAATGALVARSAGQRLPGAPATGQITATGPSAGVADDLARARSLMGEDRTLDAIKVYDSVLRRDPRHPEALAYRGWLLRLAGRAAANRELLDKGFEYIDRAVAADPGYPDARFFRGVALFQDRGAAAASLADLRAFLASGPPPAMVAMVEDLLRRATAAAAGGPAPAGAPATTDPSGSGPAAGAATGAAGSG